LRPTAGAGWATEAGIPNRRVAAVTNPRLNHMSAFRLFCESLARAGSREIVPGSCNGQHLGYMGSSGALPTRALATAEMVGLFVNAHSNLRAQLSELLKHLFCAPPEGERKSPWGQQRRLPPSAALMMDVLVVEPTHALPGLDLWHRHDLVLHSLRLRSSPCSRTTTFSPRCRICVQSRG